MIRAALPGGRSGTSPGRAGSSAATGSTVVPGTVRSARRTAKPSIAAIGSAGTCSGLRTAAASTRSRACSSGTVSAERGGVTAARISSRHCQGESLSALMVLLRRRVEAQVAAGDVAAGEVP